MRNNEKTVKASSKLMSIPDDIDGLLLEVKGQEVQESGLPGIDDLTPAIVGSKKTPIRDEVTPTDTGETPLPLWDAFLDYGNSYAYRVKVSERKVYGIDLDISNTLKGLEINKMSVTNMINAILRAFIVANKDELKKYFKHTDSLI